MASESPIKNQVKVLQLSDPSSPPLVLQITQMVDTYMLWIGAVDNSANVGNGENAVLNGNLCKDWACAMPPSSVRNSIERGENRNADALVNK